MEDAGAGDSQMYFHPRRRAARGLTGEGRRQWAGVLGRGRVLNGEAGGWWFSCQDTWLLQALEALLISFRAIILYSP